MHPSTHPIIRHDWSTDELLALMEQPFIDLLFLAQQTHRTAWAPNTVQRCTLLSIKTGGCAEDCAYCPQSARYTTDVNPDGLLPLRVVLERAQEAKASGATRYCMGAAWRSPKGRNFDRVLEMVREVRALGLETCMTLGMLEPAQAHALKDAGLDYYNHNIDTSPAYYDKIITTRTMDDRLQTLDHVRDAGIHVCCGGIVGLGESREDRAAMIATLATMPKHPESVPINQLVRVPGTPLADADDVDPLEFVRTIAVARIAMPASYIRLSAGREEMSDELQAWCFFAGANSIFYGGRLLTTKNPDEDRDTSLFRRMGLVPEPPKPTVTPAADTSTDAHPSTSAMADTDDQRTTIMSTP